MHAAASCSAHEMSDQFYWQELVLQLTGTRPIVAGGVDAIGCNKIKDLIEVSVGRIGDDQVFRRDRSFPLETMSAFIASASDDLRYSPRRYAASAVWIFAR